MGAPERIWANGLGMYGEYAGFGGVEYIRADLVPQWQPIETCPKTHTARLVWVPENQCIYCVAWQEDREYPWSGEWGIFGGGHRDLIQRATHWQPLPAPPT